MGTPPEWVDQLHNWHPKIEEPETVPEMARRVSQEQAAQHKSKFVERYTQALVEAESLAAIIALFERAYDELHG